MPVVEDSFNKNIFVRMFLYNRRGNSQVLSVGRFDTFVISGRKYHAVMLCTMTQLGTRRLLTWDNFRDRMVAAKSRQETLQTNKKQSII